MLVRTIARSSYSDQLEFAKIEAIFTGFPKSIVASVQRPIPPLAANTDLFSDDYARPLDRIVISVEWPISANPPLMQPKERKAGVSVLIKRESTKHRTEFRAT